MSNYADDNSPFEIGCNANEVIKKLEEDAIILIQWFTNNFLKPNPSKWHLLLSDINNEHCIGISNQIISNSETEKTLGVTFDNKLNFKFHISKLCKQAGQKLHALGRVSNFMSCTQRKIIMNAFISSQFNYCPLIWMGHDRTIHKQINRIYHRALSIVYRDYTSSFETLLEKSGSVTIHQRNIQKQLKYLKPKITFLPPLCQKYLLPRRLNITCELVVAYCQMLLVQVLMV